jgi:hypothetical protein
MPANAFTGCTNLQTIYVVSYACTSVQHASPTPSCWDHCRSLGLLCDAPYPTLRFHLATLAPPCPATCRIDGYFVPRPIHTLP